MHGYVCSKSCKSSTYWDKKVKKDKSILRKYRKWKAKHECLKTFQNHLEKLWPRSEEKKKLRYTTFVGDGDSLAYSAVCALNNENGQYGKEFAVAKEECINHMPKRIGARMRALKKEMTKPVATKKRKNCAAKYTWWRLKAN